MFHNIQSNSKQIKKYDDLPINKSVIVIAGELLCYKTKQRTLVSCGWRKIINSWVF